MANLENPMNPTDGPLSYGQRSLWFVQRLAPTATAYNISLTARARGVDPAALRDAWQALLDRHGALRTAYPAPGGTPVARVHPHVPLDFAEIDAAGLSASALEERVAAEANRPFDLERGPVVRLRLFDDGAGEPALLVGIHHIAVDFASMAILLDELGTLYAARQRGEIGEAARLPEIPATYADFVRWQEDLLAGRRGEELLSYWRGRLAGSPPLLALPADRPRPRFQSFKGGLHPVHLGAGLTRSLKALAAAEGVSLSALILAGFQALLHRYSGQQDVPVGSPVPGRGFPEIREVVGYFVNTVVLRADLAGGPTFRRFLARTKTRVEEALACQDYPFPLLVERLKPDREASASPFFQVFYVLYEGSEERVIRLLTGEAGATLELGPLTLRPYPLPGQAAMFDLSVLLCDAGDRVAGFLQYSTDLFDAATIATVGADLEALLTAVAADPDLPVAALPASLGEARKSRESASAAPPASTQERESAQDRAEARRALLERQKRLRRG
jgi:hypothetical protein